MDSSEGPAQRPVTLDISDVAEPDKPQDTVSVLTDTVSVLTDTCTSSTAPTSEVLFPEESIDLGGDAEPFTSPQDDSLASGSLMDRLNDQMMESVMISDSPNNSEEDDVAPMDSLLEQFEDSRTPESPKDLDDGVGEPKTPSEALEEQSTTEIQMESPSQDTLLAAAAENQVEEEKTELKTMEEEPQDGEKESVASLQTPEEPPSSVSSDGGATEADLQVTGSTPKEDPIPVCTIFSQGAPPKSLVPDGFQPTMVKSPSFSSGSGSGSGSAETPSKLAPLVCQPSPSLSKFFSDNGGVNPSSDFFDSFTTSSSFISVSNPNAAESPKATPTPERQISTGSSTGPSSLPMVAPQESSSPGSFFSAPPPSSSSMVDIPSKHPQPGWYFY